MSGTYRKTTISVNDVKGIMGSLKTSNTWYKELDAIIEGMPSKQYKKFDDLMRSSIISK